MPIGIPVLDNLMVILFWLVPLVFIEGILLLVTTAENYQKIEDVLGREIRVIKTKLIPKMETNIYGFCEWLLKRKIIIGVSCIVYAVGLLLFLLRI